MASHLVAPGEADDVTQEAYLRVWRALPGFRGDSSARTWLLTIARRTVRRRRPEPGSGGGGSVGRGERPSPGRRRRREGGVVLAELVAGLAVDAGRRSCSPRCSGARTSEAARDLRRPGRHDPIPRRPGPGQPRGALSGSTPTPRSRPASPAARHCWRADEPSDRVLRDRRDRGRDRARGRDRCPRVGPRHRWSATHRLRDRRRRRHPGAPRCPRPRRRPRVEDRVAQRGAGRGDGARLRRRAVPADHPRRRVRERPSPAVFFNRGQTITGDASRVVRLPRRRPSGDASPTATSPAGTTTAPTGWAAPILRWSPRPEPAPRRDAQLGGSRSRCWHRGTAVISGRLPVDSTAVAMALDPRRGRLAAIVIVLAAHTVLGKVVASALACSSSRRSSTSSVDGAPRRAASSRSSAPGVYSIAGVVIGLSR